MARHLLGGCVSRWGVSFVAFLPARPYSQWRNSFFLAVVCALSKSDRRRGPVNSSTQRSTHPAVPALARAARAAAAGIYPVVGAQLGRRGRHWPRGKNSPLGAVRQLRSGEGFRRLGAGDRPLPGAQLSRETVPRVETNEQRVRGGDCRRGFQALGRVGRRPAGAEGLFREAPSRQAGITGALLFRGADHCASLPPSWAGRSTPRDKPFCARGSRLRDCIEETLEKTAVVGRVDKAAAAGRVDKAAAASRVDKAAAASRARPEEQSP